jgi:hypothetical protein
VDGNGCPSGDAFVAGENKMANGTDRQALRQKMSDAQSALEAAIANADPRARDEARLAFQAAHAQVEQQLVQLGKAAPPAAPTAPANLNAEVYPYPNYNETQIQSGGLFPLPFVGVCLSGGGSRSASASMGALRALRYLGLLDKVTFISTVSGGRWAGAPYTYCPDVISDDTLLGPMVLDPSILTWDTTGNPTNALNVLNARAMGSLCTRVGITELLEQAIELYADGVAVEGLWNRAIGRLVLEPFGLGDHLANGVPTMYFSYTTWWRDNIVRAVNPGLPAASFYIVQMSAGRTHRSY